MHKFSHTVRATIFTLSIAIFALAPAAQAMAERDHHKQGRNNSYSNHSNKHSYKRQHNRKHTYGNRSHKYSQNRYNSHKRYNRHNRNSYSYGYGYGNYGYGGHFGYSNYGSRGGEVALGLLTGGLLFYALTANQRNKETVYVQQQPVYAQPTQQQWAQQQPAQPENIDRSCLQVREYQTTITVGNQTVPAYGQSCLQADGSWKLGPAIPEPGY